MSNAVGMSFNKLLLLIVSVYPNDLALCTNSKIKLQHFSEFDVEEQPEADTLPTAGPVRRGRVTRGRARYVRGQHSLREQGIGFCVSWHQNFLHYNVYCLC